jgi:hypothetical protein
MRSLLQQVLLKALQRHWRFLHVLLSLHADQLITQTLRGHHAPAHNPIHGFDKSCPLSSLRFLIRKFFSLVVLAEVTSDRRDYLG